MFGGSKKKPPEMIREIWGAAGWNEDKNQHFLGILRVVQAMYGFPKSEGSNLLVWILWVLSHHRREENLGIKAVCICYCTSRYGMFMIGGYMS